LPNPGYKIKGNIKNMANRGARRGRASTRSFEIEIKDSQDPARQLLGGEGKRFQIWGSTASN